MGAILEAERPYLDPRMVELLHVSGNTGNRAMTPARRAAYDARRAKDRPICPQCGQDEARTAGGGQHNGRIRWKCLGCGHAWRDAA